MSVLKGTVFKLLIFLAIVILVIHLHFLLNSEEQTFPKCRAAKPRFIIKVLGWRRRASLRRLLYGLMSAEYHGFKVDLEVWLDGGHAAEVLNVATELDWVHGEKRIIKLDENYGVPFLTPRTWLQPKDNEYAFFFEDDIVVSRAYFEYCLTLLEEYRFSSQRTSDLVGISLTMPRLNEIDMVVRYWQKRPTTSDLLRIQLASSWGALYFPEAWREFVNFFQWKHENIPHCDEHVAIPEAKSEFWPRSWKRYLIEWMTMTGSYLLFPNFPEQASFTTHSREPGEHTGGSGSQESIQMDSVEKNHNPWSTVPLIRDRHYLVGMRLKPLVDLPIVSLYHQKVDSIYRLRQIGLWPAEYNQQFRTDGQPGCILDWALPTQGTDSLPSHVSYRPILDPLHQLAALSNALQLGHALNRPVKVQRDLWIPSRNETESLCSWIDCSSFVFANYTEKGRTIQLRTMGKIKVANLDAPGEDSTEVSSKTNCIMPALPYNERDIKRLFGTCIGPLTFRQLGGELFVGEADFIRRAFQPNAKMAEMILKLTDSFGTFICVGHAPKSEMPWWRAGEKTGNTIGWSLGVSLEQAIDRAILQSGLESPKVYVLNDELGWVEGDSIEVKRFMALQVCRRAAFVSCSRAHFLSKYLHRLREIDGMPVKWIDE